MRNELRTHSRSALMLCNVRVTSTCTHLLLSKHEVERRYRNNSHIILVGDGEVLSVIWAVEIVAYKLDEEYNLA